MQRIRKLLCARPHLWYQAYWLIYLIWFFALDLTVKAKYILWCPLDGMIPFCEWFVIPYCSWFALLAGVLLSLWWTDTAAYDRLCLMMFSGMTFCLVIYMILPNGLNLRPDTAALGRSNWAIGLMKLLWSADAAVNVCPSIHCQSSACMALAFGESGFAAKHPWMKPAAWVWALLICASTIFTKQHSIIDVVCGLALVIPWYFILYFRKSKQQ